MPLPEVMLKHHLRTSTIIRVAIAALIVAVIGLSISPSGHAEPLTPQHASEKVYLLRGFTNVLSPGIDQLAEELRSRNISATVANHAFAADLAREALQDCKSGRISSIVLVGHSFGASAALGMAETLKEAGIKVALIVTFDPVIKNSVPANVHLLENFYLSNGVGQPVQQGEHFHGSLKNVDLKNAELGHISVTTYPSIHAQVLRDILAANTRCRPL
jgi:pimeloyl-ACP methyl ester carboxylesterase